MRRLEELLDREDPAWPFVQEWIRAAAHPVEPLPPPEATRAEALLATQVSTQSTMSAIVYETGGLLGSGHPRLGRSIHEWNVGRSSEAYPVGDDLAGGFFGFDRDGQIVYFAPDTMKWEPLGTKYSPFLQWCFSGKLAEFYGDNRWPGWETAPSRSSHIPS